MNALNEINLLVKKAAWWDLGLGGLMGSSGKTQPNTTSTQPGQAIDSRMQHYIDNAPDVSLSSLKPVSYFSKYKSAPQGVSEDRAQRYGVPKYNTQSGVVQTGQTMHINGPAPATTVPESQLGPSTRLQWAQYAAAHPNDPKAKANPYRDYTGNQSYKLQELANAGKRTGTASTIAQYTGRTYRPQPTAQTTPAATASYPRSRAATPGRMEEQRLILRPRSGKRMT